MTPIAKCAGFLSALTASVLVLAACGSGDQDSARAAASAFMRAARDPAPALCDVVSARFLRERTGKSGAAALASCRKTARGDAGKINRAIPEGVEVTSVSVDGSTALARLDARGERTGFLRLVKEDGRWKVDGADPP